MLIKEDFYEILCSFSIAQQKKDAENRGVPRVFDTELQARQAFHAQFGSDMGNAVLDWSVCMIFTDIGSVIASERREAPEPEPTETEPETITEEAQ